jgi:hypothetical protein
VILFRRSRYKKHHGFNQNLIWTIHLETKFFKKKTLFCTKAETTAFFNVICDAETMGAFWQFSKKMCQRGVKNSS